MTIIKKKQSVITRREYINDADVIKRFKKIGYAISRATGCHWWLGTQRGKRGSGYGQFYLTPTHSTGAHVFSYESTYGAVPDGMVLDHLCRNTTCINPKHLEPSSVAENAQRGKMGILRKFCKRGHAMTDENIKIEKRGNRYCLACYEDYQQKRGAK